MTRRLAFRIVPLLTPLMVIATVTAAASGAELTGQWLGTFEDLAPGGSTTSAYMELKLSGQTVAGTAGMSESDQHEISHGKLDQGGKLSFELARPQRPIMKFDLIYDGDTIKGSVTGGEGAGQGVTGKLDLKRKAMDRAQDRAAIRAHIDRIFQAFIHKDSAELRATHAANWLGYLEGSRKMIRGVDGYMDCSGYFDPKSPYGMTGYKMREFDMIFQGDAAFVAFVADVEAKTPERAFPANPADHGLLHQAERRVDSDRFRHRPSPRIGGGTVADAAHLVRIAKKQPAGGARGGMARLLRGRPRRARKAAARGTGDAWRRAANGAIAEAVLEGSARFAAGGGKLVRLEFPKTEIQAYGSTAIVYSNYVYEIEQGGKRSANSGRVTEVFVNRNGAWVNPSWHMDAK